MTGSLHPPRLAGRAAAVVLVLSSCVGAQAPEAGAAAAEILLPPAPAASHSAVPQIRVPDDVSRMDLSGVDLSGMNRFRTDLSLVDTDGASLRDEHAEVVRAVHRALVAGDLTALSELYAGDDWAGQAELLASEQVRRSVLDALRADPANLGEGYIYPGFAADPAGPYSGPYSGYQTAFLLDEDPLQTATGALRWRGIAPGAPEQVG